MRNAAQTRWDPREAPRRHGRWWASERREPDGRLRHAASAGMQARTYATTNADSTRRNAHRPAIENKPCYRLLPSQSPNGPSRVSRVPSRHIAPAL